MASNQTDDTETSPRKKGTATGLAFLSPGLAYLYAGHFTTGLVVNALFVLALVGFLALFTWLAFFPLLPAIVFVVGWIVFSALVANDVREHIDELDEPYELRSYNHWTVYSGLCLLTFVLPIAAVLVFTGTFFWDVQRVDSTAMYPNVRPGDVVLLQKNAYRNRRPHAGELVALRFPGSENYRVLRAIAAGNSTVRLSANTVYVGERRLPRAPLGDDSGPQSAVANVGDSAAAPEANSERASAHSPTSGSAGSEASGSDDAETSTESDAEFELRVEQNGNQKYVVSVQPSQTGKPTFDSYNLAKEELFLLADNRSAPNAETNGSGARDSRSIGPVRSNAVAGKPLYVAWSTDPSTGSVRWDRIGLRLQ